MTPLPVSPTTAALLLLLVVLVTAMRSHLWVAIVVSVAAMLALNFFFLPPIGTFTIADPENWVALFAFLIVAVIASKLSAAVQARAAIAIERAQLLADREGAELVRQKADLASTLLATLSHDLRTPLTAIRVAVENLQRDLPPDARTEQAAAALSELNRLTRLFQDILDMARIDASPIRIDRQWVTPADIVDAAAAQVRHVLEGRALRVVADTENEIDIDPRLTSAALAHLLENAAQYSAPGRPITVTAQAGPAGLRIAVQDEGPGLDPSELDHLFERFYRGHAARQTSFGTGMGLAITRGLLSAAGGQVRAENVPGSGARFTITVPAVVRAVTAVEADL